MKKFLFLLLILPAFAATAQEHEVKYKDNTILVNDAPYAYMEVDGSGIYTLSDLQHKQVLVIRWHQTNESNQMNRGNPAGTVNHWKFVFMDGKHSPFEMSDTGGYTKKQMAKFIEKNHLFKDGKLDDSAVDVMAAIYQ